MVPLVPDSPMPGLYGGNLFRKKMAVAMIWTIINFEIRMKGMAARADRTCYLTVRLNN